jgi:hypothetical protein
VPFAVQFDDPSIVWEPEESTLALQVRDVQARTEHGQLVASAPLLRATVAVDPLLLERRLELVSVRLELPEIGLTRDDQGRLALRFAGEPAEIPLTQTAGSGGLAALLGDASGSSDPRLAGLRLVEIEAPSLVYSDEETQAHATAADAAFRLKQNGSSWIASLEARVGDGHIEASAATTTPPQQAVDVELQRLPPSALAALAPSLPLSGLALPMSGRLHFLIDPSGDTRGAGTFDLTAQQGQIGLESLGLAPVAVRSAELHGRLSTGWQEVQIDRLALAGNAYELGLSGRVADVAGRLQADLDLTAGDLDVPEILTLWPTAVASGARDWIQRHVPAGSITGASFQIADDEARPDQMALGGKFAFHDLELHYLDTLPPATGLSGTARLAGDSLAFATTAGRTGGVDLGAGEVTLSNLIGAGVSRLEVKLDLRSTLPAALQLLDAPPVELGKKTGLSPGSASGNQATRLTLSLPLLDDLTAEQIRYRADTRLSGIEIKNVQPGYSLAARELSLAAEPSGVSANGEVTVNGARLVVELRDNTAPIKGVRRRARVTGQLDAATATALKFDWPSVLRGAVGFEASVVEARDPLRSVDLKLDLTPTALDVPALALAKAAGQPGTASANLVQKDEAGLVIDKARLEAAGWIVEGGASLRLDPMRADRIALTRLRGPPGDLTADLALRDGLWRGRVDIGQLDLRQALGSGGDQAGGGMMLPEFAIQLAAQRLRLGDTPFSQLKGTIERRGGIWQSANFQANIADSTVNFDLATANARSIVNATGSDAGWVIRSLSNTDNGIRGGSLRLSADLNQKGGLSGGGQLKIRDFTLWGAPTIARIVSLASFSGLANALSGKGVPVRRLVAPFTLQNNVITLNEARLFGSDIGARADGTIDLTRSSLNLSGTVAPAYTINRFLGKIPIIGQLMSGGKSDALLAATFSVRGPLAAPQVSVNPLAALVPGVIRDLFDTLGTDEQGSGPRDR